MKTKSHKRRSTYADNSKLCMRSVTVRAETLDETNRSVEVVIATENPVERYDFATDQIIHEVLLMDGVEFRTSKRQLPIVDSHDRSSVKNVLGSVRDLRVEGDELIGRAVFASDDDSQTAFQKLREGHLTDFSITATPNEIIPVTRGETYKTRKRTIDGPAEIITRWRPSDASIVAAGADERATVRDSLRRSYEMPFEQEGKAMSAISIDQLHEMGMPETLKTDEEIHDWLVNSLRNESTDPEPEPEPEPTPEPEPAPEPAPEPEPTPEPAEPEAVLAHALKTERDRQREIRALCEKSRVDRALADTLCETGASLDEARRTILERLMKDNPTNPVGTAPAVTGSAIDRTYNAVRDGLIQRTFTASGVRQKPFETIDPSEGAGDFKYAGLLRMAEALLASGGLPVQRMAPRDIAMVALGHEPTIRRLRIQRDTAGYHTTGSFANLLLDASNKTLLAAYDEAPYTWSTWARQAASVPDFKNINRLRLSESPDLEHVAENHDYSEANMTDSKETYFVEKFGKTFSVTWETVVNDDLDAISRVPAMFGNAARRTQNKKVYEVLTENGNMNDGTALFHADHNNLDGSGAAPSVTELNAAFIDMMKQTGLNSDVIINVQPRYIIGPAALAGTILQLLGSIADPNAGGSAAGNANTLNIYGPNGVRPLTPIIEPQLDANSATAWYLAAEPTAIDTVELAFLQGEETPVLDQEFVFGRDVWNYKVRQTFGVAAIDWRGLYKNPGT